jgi:superfamily II DNA or RNA helicase
MEKIIKHVETIEKTCPIAIQPLSPSSLLKVQLRDYQLEGLSWMNHRYLNDVSVILGDEMGLGKTLQTIALIASLIDSKVRPPFLVIAPLSVIGNWVEEFKVFAHSITCLKYIGSQEVREASRTTIINFIRQQPKKDQKDPELPFQVLITSYDILMMDIGFLAKFQWRLVVVDEAQRLKNSNSKLYTTMMEELKMPHKVLLSGTPIQNNLSELWALLHFVMPNLFLNLETFTDYFQEINSPLKQSNDKRDKKIELLHRLLRPFILRRTKEEVLGDLPAKKEMILYTGLSEMQLKYYRWILTKDVKTFSKDKNSLMNVVVNLRKACNHPYLFNGAEPLFEGEYKSGDHIILNSGKLVVLDKLLPKLKADGEKVLIFSQMTRMLDICQDYLDFKKYSYQRLDGSVRGDDRYATIKNFKEKEDSFVFLLSTRAGGLGLNLTEATVVIFLDSDWNPQADLQAQARVHRIGQLKEVKIIRLVTQHSVEEVILKRAYQKLALKYKVLDKGNFNSLFTVDKNDDFDIQLSDVVKYGLSKLLEANNNINDEDINTILSRTKEISSLQVGSDVKPNQANQEQEHDSIYFFDGVDYTNAQVEAEDEIAFTKLRSSHQEILHNAMDVDDLPQSQSQSQSQSSPITPSRKEAKWAKNNYTSYAIKLDPIENSLSDKKSELKRTNSDKPCLQRLGSLLLDPNINESIESAMEEDDDEFSINYREGDASKVTEPYRNSIILLCCDNSGIWCNNGFFKAIGKLSDLPAKYYELAGKMSDLHVGSAHLVPVSENPVSDGQQLTTHQYVALLICQSRKQGLISSFNMTHFHSGLLKISQEAKALKASIHLPRIGAEHKDINYYSIEKLVQNVLAADGLNVNIYYYKNPAKLNKESSSQSNSPKILSQSWKNSQDSSSTPKKIQTEKNNKRKFESDSDSEELSPFVLPKIPRTENNNNNNNNLLETNKPTLIRFPSLEEVYSIFDSKEPANNSSVLLKPSPFTPEKTNNQDSMEKPTFSPQSWKSPTLMKPSPSSSKSSSMHNGHTEIEKNLHGKRFHLLYIHHSLVSKLTNAIVAQGGEIDFMPTNRTDFIVTDITNSDQVGILQNQFPTIKLINPSALLEK